MIPKNGNRLSDKIMLKRNAMFARRTFLACTMAVAMTRDSSAQSQRTIRMIVPFTPGSPNDVIARLLAQHLSVRMGRA